MLLGKVVDDPKPSHEVYGEKFYQFNLEVKRLSGSVDIIPILFSFVATLLTFFSVGRCGKKCRVPFSQNLSVDFAPVNIYY